MRSRRLGETGAVHAVLAVAVAALVGAACAEENTSSSTLPPIQTTTTTTIAVAPTTTLPRFYEVQEGDTLTRIAEAYGLPIPVVMKANGITDQDSIYVGQILEMPDPGSASDGDRSGTTTAP